MQMQINNIHPNSNRQWASTPERPYTAQPPLYKRADREWANSKNKPAGIPKASTCRFSKEMFLICQIQLM